MAFFVARDDEIKSGKTTDIYFVRTEEILRQKGVHKRVTAEFTVSSLPSSYEWAIFGGLAEVIELLEGREVDLYALPEGTLFRNRDARGIPVPVMVIEGDYLNFAVFETPALGFICQTSGIMTKAARVRKSAGDAIVLSFGIRRMHPSIAPLIDRAAYIGGCDGVSSVKGAEFLRLKPSGTMPHSLIIVMGEEEAWRAFDELMGEDVPRIALIDTYGDEKNEAIKAAETIRNLLAVRLDTPGSRRGDFPAIIREVRWELDIRGFTKVGIFVSGGLDENTIPPLLEAGATGFGVGTSISNAPTIDYAMDIVEVEGEPRAKKGKFGGKKKVYRCESCLNYVVTHGEVRPSTCPICGGEMREALVPYLRAGKAIRELPSIEEMRKYVLDQLEKVEP